MSALAARQPVLFVSHGSPMHAIEPGAAGEAWRALGKALPAPRAILVASAHWEGNLPMLTGAGQPATVHDFGGFPAPLYRIQYPAPGAPALAQRTQKLLHASGICSGIDAARGRDHGTWVPLLQLFPAAEVPVLQISIQPERGARHHYAIGRALAALRDEGVLMIGSGHMTHNLRDFFTLRPGSADAQYARVFRDWVDARIAGTRIEELLDWESAAPHARRAHPTTEHFLPLFVALGAAGEGARVSRVFSGFEGETLAMDAYRFD